MADKPQRSQISPHPLPPKNLLTKILPTTDCKTIWYRLNNSSFDSAIYFDRSGLGRYDAPAQSYGICYVGENVEAAFIESFGRNHGAIGVAEEDLRTRNLFEIKSNSVLTLVDLFGSGLVKIGADARITSGSDYDLSRAWTEAIYNHPSNVDGIRYCSRHDNTQLCVGLFDRTRESLTETNLGNLIDNKPQLLADILAYYNYALL